MFLGQLFRAEESVLHTVQVLVLFVREVFWSLSSLLAWVTAVKAHLLFVHMPCTQFSGREGHLG